VRPAKQKSLQFESQIAQTANFTQYDSDRPGTSANFNFIPNTQAPLVEQSENIEWEKPRYVRINSKTTNLQLPVSHEDEPEASDMTLEQLFDLGNNGKFPKRSFLIGKIDR